MTEEAENSTKDDSSDCSNRLYKRNFHRDRG